MDIINWDFLEIVAKAIVVIGGMIVSLYQVYTRLPKSRSSLTRDIEILNILDKKDPVYPIVRAHVEKQITEIYEPSEPSNQGLNIKGLGIYNWPNLFIGVVFLAIFGLWTYSLYNAGSWWGILTGFLAVGGIGNIIIAFDKSARNRRESTA